MKLTVEQVLRVFLFVNAQFENNPELLKTDGIFRISAPKQVNERFLQMFANNASDEEITATLAECKDAPLAHILIGIAKTTKEFGTFLDIHNPLNAKLAQDLKSNINAALKSANDEDDKIDLYVEAITDFCEKLMTSGDENNLMLSKIYYTYMHIGYLAQLESAQNRMNASNIGIILGPFFTDTTVELSADEYLPFYSAMNQGMQRLLEQRLPEDDVEVFFQHEKIDSRLEDILSAFKKVESSVNTLNTYQQRLKTSLESISHTQAILVSDKSSTVFKFLEEKLQEKATYEKAIRELGAINAQAEQNLNNVLDEVYIDEDSAAHLRQRLARHFIDGTMLERNSQARLDAYVANATKHVVAASSAASSAAPSAASSSTMLPMYKEKTERQSKMQSKHRGKKRKSSPRTRAEHLSISKKRPSGELLG